MSFFSGFRLQFFLFLLFVHFAFLQSTFADLTINEKSFRVDPKVPVINKTATVYLTVNNTSTKDMRGVVRVFDETEGKKVEIEQTFTALAQKTGDVFFVFTPTKAGNHTMSVKIIPWENYAENNISNDKISTVIWVDSDFDGDGIGDSIDEDDDNDGIPDKKDAFPKNAKESGDMDGDKIGDNEDSDMDGDDLNAESEMLKGTDPKNFDTDGDGVSDSEDDFPLNKNFQYDTDKDGTPNQEDTDDDGDGIGDDTDIFPVDGTESKDSDGDKVGDNTDPDDDNDGLLDEDEHRKGANPFDKDTDKDGILDGEDAFPTDVEESKDSDLDGIGDKTDSNNSNKGPFLKIADFSTQIFRGQLLEISAIESFDPEGGNLSFVWEILDEKGTVKISQTGSRFQAVFHGLGEQKIRLTVRDEADEIRTKDFWVSVKASKKDILFSLGFTILFLLLIIGAYIFFHKKHHALKKQR